MKKLNTLLFALCILLVTPAFANQPNIVIFFIDDMGWRDWSGGGSDYFETPNIDRIAKEGMNFTEGYVNAANCAPSRCAILSGQYTPRNHFYNVWSIHRGNKKKDRLSLNDVPDHQVFPDERTSFAEAMKKAGYKTAMYGKWHISGYNKQGSGNEGGVSATMQGFDDVYEHPAGALGALFKKDRNDPKHMYSYTNRAMQFAEKCVTEKKPFLIYLAHHAVHGGNQSRPETLQAYKNKKQGKFHNKANPAYGAMMANTDHSIGIMMDKIKQLGIDDDTVIVFLSDNGGPRAPAHRKPRCVPGKAATTKAESACPSSSAGPEKSNPAAPAKSPSWLSIFTPLCWNLLASTTSKSTLTATPSTARASFPNSSENQYSKNAPSTGTSRPILPVTKDTLAPATRTTASSPSASSAAATGNC